MFGAVGLMAMTDKTANGILVSNYISLSTSYHKSLDEEGLHQIGLGFQGTYGTKRLDGTQLKFEDGLLENGSWTISPSEPINTQIINVNYFDMNVGVLYNGSTNGANNFYFGASVYHINRPKESFTGDDFYTLHPRVTIHGGGSFPLSGTSSTNYVHVSGLVSKQDGATNVVLGGAWSVNVNNDDDNPTNFYLGSWVRFNNLTDALIPYVGLDFGSFTFGLSYDVNVSSLKTASQSRGGVELSLIYIKKPSDGRRTITCPRF